MSQSRIWNTEYQLVFFFNQITLCYTSYKSEVPRNDGCGEIDNKGGNIYYDSTHPWIQMERRRHGVKIAGVGRSRFTAQTLYMEVGVKSVHDNEQLVFHYVTISSVEIKSNGGNCVWTRALCR